MNLQKYKKRQLIIQYLYRKRYKKYYNFYLVLKLLLSNKYIEKQFKVLVVLYLINLNRFNFISYQKNICLKSGHKRSVINFFKLNRMHLMNELNDLKFPGVTKTIW